MINFVQDCLEIVPGTLSDYEKLAQYHYVHQSIEPATQILKVRGLAKYREIFPDPIAINVFRMPLPKLGPRKRATKGYFTTPETTSEKLKLVNKNIRYAARLIVDPRFRRIGIATWLIAEGLKRQQVPIVETLTPINWTCKIMQQAGFRLYLTPAPKRYNRLKTALFQLGLTEQSLSIPAIVEFRLRNMHPEQKEHTENEIKRFMHPFRRYREMPAGTERTKFMLEKLYYPGAYWIWFNPRIPLNTSNQGDNRVYRSGHPEKQVI